MLNRYITIHLLFKTVEKWIMFLAAENTDSAIQQIFHWMCPSNKKQQKISILKKSKNQFRTYAHIPPKDTLVPNFIKTLLLLFLYLESWWEECGYPQPQGGHTGEHEGWAHQILPLTCCHLAQPVRELEQRQVTVKLQYLIQEHNCQPVVRCSMVNIQYWRSKVNMVG